LHPQSQSRVILPASKWARSVGPNGTHGSLAKNSSQLRTLASLFIVRSNVFRFSRGGIIITPAAVGCKRMLDHLSTSGEDRRRGTKNGICPPEIGVFARGGVAPGFF
jgi:hypothetical protein